MTFTNADSAKGGKPGGRKMRPLKFVATTVGLLFLLLFVSCNTIGRLTTVSAGEVGIKIKNVGANAGVQKTELRQGMHVRGLFEEIVKYPTRARPYQFTREANQDGKENEEISFADKTGLPMTADVQITVRVMPDRAADLYDEFKLDFDDLIDNPIRNDVRSFLARETEKVPVACNLNPTPAATGQTPTPVAGSPECSGSLMGAGRQEVLQKAFLPLKTKWAAKGVEISDMQWIGTIRYPEAIQSAIKARTETEQRTLQAQAREAEARANANAQIEQARGEAESIRLRAQAIASNPQLIEQIYAERSKGICPPTARVCIVGAGAGQLLNIDGNQ